MADLFEQMHAVLETRMGDGHLSEGPVESYL
jgi:hypothetical protein